MMSSHSEQGEERSRGFSLDDELKSLDAENLYNLVRDLIRKNPEVHRLVLEWFKEKAEASRVVEEVVTLNDELLMEYWEKAEYIISEFNEYGGGPEDEEEDAYEWLNKISELIEAGNISLDAKLEFFDCAFVEYDMENSGFEDALMDIFFAMCETKEEWEYLVAKLAKRPSDWRKKLIMRIQKNYLCNETAYLEMRMENLHYGMDYWDLFEYYKTQGNYEKAKEAQLKAYKIMRYGNYYAEYKKLKKFMRDADWKQVEPKIFKDIKEKDICDYLRICLDKNMKEAVLHTILNPPENQWIMKNEFDEFAAKLEEDFPERIIEYYWQSAYRNIPGGNRNTYRIATGYLAKVKHIYINMLKDESRWEKRFSELKAEFKNRPAFLDEVREL